MAAAVTLAEAEASPARPGLAASNSQRLTWLLVGVAVLVVVILASIAVGSRDIPLPAVLDALLHGADSDDRAIIMTLRIPRTLLGLAVGIALGLSGALIQALTRNPLADPGILGVNSGAALFVAVGVGYFGFTSIGAYVWFAFAGAVAATLVVYAIGSVGRGAADPIRLTLAGVAMAAVLNGATTGLTLLNPAAFDRWRFWHAGSLTTPGFETTLAVAPFMIAGILLALFVSRSLNAVALGEDLARSLGANVLRTRVLVVIAVTLLAGAATAAVGPIAFVGLMVPHVARWICGPDQRWIAAFTLVLAPILLIVSDILGRIVMRPGELQVGIVTAFVGAPVLIVLARRRKVSGL